MAFPDPRDHRISLQAAAELTRRYRESDPGQVKACMFPRGAFEAILKQPNCLGIRLYFGRNEKGALDVVMVGVDGDGRDMKTGELEQNGYPCPPFCDDDDKELNG